ncbi:hypothetical protein DQP55_13360 [Mycolicibacterium sp. GF69]|uniref:hypothetical protein n=1 Tax=Mycolicibacterium sp. GF69 TaxID=2267251 RepID=UPI000DCD952D|nr:hypothetical protein [Mycolicibacterium sp. GF69]RAV11616.1 hypothetical protein DQP55_13360 [Mycolicibacterium sp. GF69]
MTRSLMVAFFAVALSCLSLTASASADPNTAPGDQPCNFTLSTPHVVQVSGTDMVSVTMAPAACDGGTPYQSIACIQVQGSPGPGRCTQNNGPLMARVYYSPYQPGTTYVATGKGCASKGNPPQPFCAPTGPLTATL